MSKLISRPVYGERDPITFLEEMNSLTLHHMQGCVEFARMWPDWKKAERAEELPFVHVGVFKQLELKTTGKDIKHERVVLHHLHPVFQAELFLMLEVQNCRQKARRRY
jgi:hypothetical protein